jgi:superfamily II DNA/RNA helicase
MSFSDLGLSAEILRGVADAGYTEPTPIQFQAIPYILMGRDVLGCAQTGTGKTASFTLPMIDILASGRARARMPRSLIIEPTRELAAQVAENFDVYGKHVRLTHALLIGGESFTDQERKLDRGVDVLIATPGRLIDLYERGKIMLNDVKILVIDEADRMLDMGFIPDVEKIVSLLPKIRQTLFFSATMPHEIRKLADAFLSNPREVTVSRPATASAMVKDAVIFTTVAAKRDVLRLLLRREPVRNALIFCNRKKDVEIVSKSLQRHGFDARPLHGDLSQPKRTETLEAFRRNEVTILVASDVAARGLDIEDLSHVFIFDVPYQAEDYVHRMGRTGRAGREGHAFMIATSAEGRHVSAIERLIGRKIPRLTLDDAPAAGETEEAATASTGSEKPSEGARRPRSRAPRRGPRAGAPARGEATVSARSESSSLQSQPAAPVPSEVAAAPIDAVAPARSETAQPARNHPPRREAERPRREAERPRREAENQRRDGRRPRQETDDEGDVLAFGDHLPAFMGSPRARSS